ncbi:hypothetical protein L596_029811 [Steinernema carpocapsae]|uniref:ShKT domain-containing protein n=1 Tax=Steinernema carpocapsae TaxID=34508 RepID=A0A4U5LQV3_STECR|nr:hypothetical protein L596_029811 [Steinernema carpocapsae]
MRVWVRSLLSVFLFVALFQRAEPADACQKLAICALDKCITAPKQFPPEDKLVEFLLHQANFGCILGPTCYEFCSKCDSCNYAQTQIKKLVLREQTDGLCPKMESCAKSCLDDQVHDPFSCVFRSRCSGYCLSNEDCPQCRDIVKRVFTGYCYRSGFIDHYGKKCRPMFEQLVSSYRSS